VVGILITLLIIGAGYYFYRKRKLAREVENKEDGSNSAENPLEEERKNFIGSYWQGLFGHSEGEIKNETNAEIGAGNKFVFMFQGLFNKRENAGDVSKTSKHEATDDELPDIECGSSSVSSSSYVSSSSDSGSGHDKTRGYLPPVSSAATPVLADRTRGGDIPPFRPKNGTARQEPEPKKYVPPTKNDAGFDYYSDDDSSSSSSLSSHVKKASVKPVFVEMPLSFPVSSGTAALTTNRPGQ
jgi:hypothetical protein